MLSCRDLLEEIGEYLEASLGPSARREIEVHLSECHACRVLYDSSSKSLRIVTDSRAFEIPTSVADRIMARIREASTSGRD